MNGVKVFKTPSKCYARWQCLPSATGKCTNCGGEWLVAPKSECCGVEIVSFSSDGPAQCVDCGISPTYPVGIAWPDHLASVEWPARVSRDVLSDGHVEEESVREQLEELARNGWHVVAVSPNHWRDEETGEVVAQFLLSR